MTDHKHHIIPLKTYLIVFATLLLMTGLTIFSAQYDFGFFNIILALLIAGFKSSLVLLFFMHLYYDNKINLALIIGSVLFVAIFIGLTMIDTEGRAAIYEKKSELVKEKIEYEQKTSEGSHH